MIKIGKLKGVKFLAIVLLVYLTVTFFDPQNTQVALLKAFAIVLQIWPVFIFIILLTTLVNYYLKPKQILNHFGQNSGKKGILYALLAGIVSHGPMYAWYGLIQELREKGAKDELLIIFFYARAIKIPMIPFSIAVFGTPFTIIISLYILIFAVIQGKLFSYLNNR